MQKNKRNFIGLIVLFFLLPFSAYANFFTAAVSGGFNYSSLYNEPLVIINSFVTNAYLTQKEQQSNIIVGLSLGHTLEKNLFDTFELSYQFSGYLLNLGQVTGIEHPFINIGTFDTLNYQFNTESAAILLEPQIAYTYYPLQPFVLIGIGGAKNRLKDYNEVPTDPTLSAAPVFPMFSSQSKAQFAYELGVGIQHVFINFTENKFQCIGGISYRYFNFGKAALGHFPAQTVNSNLYINSFNTQALLLKLALSFG